MFRGRFVHSRPTEPGDLKYAGAAWRMGKFNLDHFEAPEDMPGDVFIDLLTRHLTLNYQAHHTLIADSPEGRVPVGMALSYWPDRRAPVLWLGHIMWFPWASARNRLETVVHFMNAMRGDWTILEFAREEDRPFFDHVCRYGVMSRVGTSRSLYAEPAAVYETYRPKLRKAEWPSVQSSAQ